MAERIGEGEKNGRKTWVYENGTELYQDTMKIAVPAPHTLNFTGNKDTNPHQRRLQKTAALIRSRIVDETKAVAPVPVGTPAQAVAYAAGQLWSEIVLNDEAYPRDRMEAWEKISKYGESLPADMRQTADPAPAGASLANAVAILPELIRVLTEVIEGKPRQVIEGTVKESENK